MTVFDRAKLVVAEIVRQSSGNELVGTARLYKAFYFAHLYYARDNARYLTDWPVVKMPMQPAFLDFKKLTDELARDGVLEVTAVRVGPFPAVKYRWVAGDCRQSIEPEAVEAIRKAVEFVAGKTGAQLSDITHEFSLSWREAELDDELSIYLDLLDVDDYEKAKARAVAASNEMAAVWKGELTKFFTVSGDVKAD